jgi:hypothetical protein
MPVGDIIDKITILRIKFERIGDAGKRENVRRELEMLERIYIESFPAAGPDADRLADQLHEVNLTLWDVEDELRECERRRDFSDGFISLARSVYATNDRRAALKRDLNVALGSTLVEEKSYAGG